MIERTLRRVAGEVPVVVGVSSPGLANVALLTGVAMSAGAAAVMLAPPPGLATDEQIEGYLHHACAMLGADVPVVLQDYPQATGVHLSVGLIDRLIDQVPQIKVLKHEDCPGLAKISQIRASAERDDRRRIGILIGNGALYYPLELARGADGAMTGFAFPEVLVKVYERFAAGRVEDAFDLFDAYLPLIRYEQQPGVGLAIRKQILHRRGVLASPRVRPPGARLDARDRAELESLLTRVKRRVEGRHLSQAHAWLRSGSKLLAGEELQHGRVELVGLLPQGEMARILHDHELGSGDQLCHLRGVRGLDPLVVVANEDHRRHGDRAQLVLGVVRLGRPHLGDLRVEGVELAGGGRQAGVVLAGARDGGVEDWVVRALALKPSAV